MLSFADGNFCKQFGPDLDPNCLSLRWLRLKKVSNRQHMHEHLPSMQIVKLGLLPEEDGKLLYDVICTLTLCLLVSSVEKGQTHIAIKR